MKIYAIVLAAAICLVSTPLYAQGVLLVQSETQGGKTTTNQIQMDKNNMRTESGGQSMMFDGQKQIMRILDLNKKTYQEINKADLDQLKSQMDGAMAQLQNLPPAQRQMMEQAMQGRGMPGMPGMGAAAAPPKPEYRANGTDKVGAWTCNKYDGYVNGQKTVEVCAVDPAVLNLNAADFEVGRQMQEFMKSLVPAAADKMILNGTVASQGYAGMAVRRTTFINGVADTVTEIKELRRETFPASTFAVPSGFKKEASSLGRGAR